jgi:hypothetical protein
MFRVPICNKGGHEDENKHELDSSEIVQQRNEQRR